MGNIKPRVASVDIYQGDDLQRLAELHQKAQLAKRRYLQAKATNSLTIGDDDEGAAAAEAEYDAFLDEATERAVTFELRHIGTVRWGKLKAKHPARKVARIVDGTETESIHDDDLEYGINSETLPLALLTYVDPDDTDVRTITAPVYKKTADLEEELAEISDGDMTRLWTAAFYLNTSVGADPKAARFSAAPQSSEEISA